MPCHRRPRRRRSAPTLVSVAALALVALCASACGLDWQRYRLRDAAADATPCTNVLMDPSFEQELMGFGGRWIDFEATVTRVAVAAPHSGNYVGRVVPNFTPGNTDALWFVFARTPPTPPGTRRVIASAWVRLAPGSPPLPMMSMAMHERRLVDQPDGGRALESCQTNWRMVTPLGRTLTSATDWVRIEGVFEMPVTDGHCEIDVEIAHEGYFANAGFEVDDVSACFVQ